MNAFNRILVLFGLLFLLIGSGSLLLITIGLLNPQEWVPAPWHQILTPFTQLDPVNGWTVVNRLTVVGICVVLVIASVLLLLMELRVRSNKVPELSVKKDAFGQITASMRSIQDLVNREAGKIDGVLETTTTVKDTSRGIQLQCQICVAPYASVTQLGQVVQERIKSSVEHYLGKSIARIHLQTHIAPLAQGTKKSSPRVR